MTTTPYDARRSIRIREASEKAYHLAHIIKDYPNHRKDGSQFGASQLDRIEKVLAETTEMVIEMANAEHKQLLDQPGVEPVREAEARGVVLGFDGALQTDYSSRIVADLTPKVLTLTDADGRVMEQTIPPSLLERIAAREECD